MKITYIMIVEPDEDDTDLLQKALVEIDRGFICTSFTNFDAAYEYLRTEEGKPDLIFVDLNSTIGLGLKFIEKLNIAMDLKNIPKIVFASPAFYADYFDRIEGVSDYLLKPYSYTRLLDDLRSMLENE